MNLLVCGFLVSGAAPDGHVEQDVRGVASVAELHIADRSTRNARALPVEHLSLNPSPARLDHNVAERQRKDW